MTGACALLLASCGRPPDGARPLSAREYAEQREREINDSGPSWAQELAAAPGADDVERAIALLHRGNDIDYRAVSLLVDELDVSPNDERIRRVLIEVVNEASFPARDLAAGALGKHGVTEARSVLLKKLEQPHFAGPIVVALGQLGDASTVRELDYLAEHASDEQVARSARSAKQLIEERLAPPRQRAQR